MELRTTQCSLSCRTLHAAQRLPPPAARSEASTALGEVGGAQPAQPASTDGCQRLASSHSEGAGPGAEREGFEPSAGVAPTVQCSPLRGCALPASPKFRARPPACARNGGRPSRGPLEQRESISDSNSAFRCAKRLARATAIEFELYFSLRGAARGTTAIFSSNSQSIFRSARLLNAVGLRLTDCAARSPPSPATCRASREAHAARHASRGSARHGGGVARSLRLGGCARHVAGDGGSNACCSITQFEIRGSARALLLGNIALVPPSRRLASGLRSRLVSSAFRFVVKSRLRGSSSLIS